MEAMGRMVGGGNSKVGGNSKMGKNSKVGRNLTVEELEGGWEGKVGRKAGGIEG